MALVPCPECKAKISDTADKCPRCGFPTPPEVMRNIKERHAKAVRIGGLTVIGVIIAFVVIANIGEKSDVGHKQLAAREPDTRSDQEKIDSAARMLAVAVANGPPVPTARKVASQVEDEFSTLVHADPTLSELCFDLGKVRAAWIAAGVARTAELWGETRDRACGFGSSYGDIHLSTFKGSSDKSKQDFYSEITDLAL
jgi:hypothetical protein